MTNSTKFTLPFLLLLLLFTTADANAKDSVYLYVLGIAQDGGCPHAGCYQPHCMRSWEDKSLRRLVSSVAVVDELNKAKYLFDATLDIREQLYELHRVTSDSEFQLGGVF